MKRKAILTAAITLSLIAGSLTPVFAANRNMAILNAETTLIDSTTLPETTEEIEQQDNGGMVSHSYDFTEEQKAQIDQEVQDYLSKTRKPNLRTIIGVDERETVVAPDNRIALIISKFPDKGFSYGTAFMISRSDFFATAAHCLYDRETGQNPEWIAVIPGGTNTTYPLGTLHGISYAYNDKFLSNNVAEYKSYDYGLIQVDPPSQIILPFKLTVLPDVSLNEYTYSGVVIPGYPQSYGGKQAVAPKKNFTFTNKFLMYKIDTSEGQSGAPIIAAGSNEVLGIHTNGIDPRISDEYNFGTRITSSVMNDFNDWINNYQ